MNMDQVHDKQFKLKIEMAESPPPQSKRLTLERGVFPPRRLAQFNSSPYSHEQSQPRNTYQPQLQQRKIFGFEIFVDNDILSQMVPVEPWFQMLARNHEVDHIRFNSDLTIPDLNGRNIQIYDVEMERKYQCAKTMLNDIYQVFKKSKKQAFSVIIFVPEGMVSLLIGTKGHQINKIMKQSHTTIVVNQPINRMTYRTAKIQGYHSDIAKACRIIYQMLQDKSSIAYSIQKEPSQFDYTKAKVKIKFIFSEHLIAHFQKKKKTILKKIQDETKCSLKFESDRDNRLLKKDQSICVVIGKLQDVQSMVVMIINLAHDFFSDEKRNQDYTLKMLIPANYVTKLIGQKGYMIRDIIQRSGGAQIKILSDKQSEKDVKECIISINGTKENKIDASCLILQQLQCFKNGGPILQSGKSINENLAQQFKNSLHLREQDENCLKIELEINSNIQVEALPVFVNVTQLPLTKTLSMLVSKQKIKEQLKNNSEEQGLIDGESQQKQNKQSKNLQKQRTRIADKQGQKALVLKKEKQHKKKSKSRESSKSRSRDKDRKKKKIQFARKLRSESSSMQYRHDRETVEMKLVIPKRLAMDQKQLKYIQSLCKSEIVISEYKGDGDKQAIISIRGNVRDNCRCLKFLQKRLARYNKQSVSGR